jgi:hypothetical protein
MKSLRFTPQAFVAIPLLFVALLTGGCASGPKVDPQITTAVAASHVNQGTYNKVFNGQSLDYADITALVQRHVASHIIVGYLRSTQRVYDFSYAQLADLKAEGAKPHLLNYLTETQGFYGNNSPVKAGGKTPKYVRDNSKLNQDKQPFFYNAPAIDDWYDSAYTESSYSPFSFN